MKRIAPLLVGLLAACIGLAGCAEARPEGPAERYLAAISRDTDPDAIAKFGDIAVASEVLGFPIEASSPENRRHLDRFEIGAATVDGDAAVVPVRIWARQEEEAAELALRLERVDGVWLVTDDAPPSADAIFPSEGGSTYGLPASTLVVVALSVMVVAFLIALLALRIAGARPLHRRV